MGNLNGKANDEIKEEPGPHESDEEFAEKLYVLEAPVSPQFDEPHCISYTGGNLHPGKPDATDAPPPENVT